MGEAKRRKLAGNLSDTSTAPGLISAFAPVTRDDRSS
jgi:hypothetical protein